MKNFATKAERTKAISLLKKARERVENRQNDWVCTAISNAAYEQGRGRGFNFSNRIAERLRREINRRIEGHSFVTSWLGTKHGISRKLLDRHEREYRLLWIDSMVAELEAM